MKMRSGKSGFTLLEIMVVVAIIGILATLAMVAYQKYIERARGSDIVVKYDALRSTFNADTEQKDTNDCADLVKRAGSARLNDDYAQLGYGFEAVAGGGYRPVLTVCATADKNGKLGIAVARGAHETLTKSSRVENGAVVTDTVVSFALPLTDGSRSLCTVAPAAAQAGCGGPAPAQATTTVAVTAPAQPQPAQSTQAFDPKTAVLASSMRFVPPDTSDCRAGQVFVVATSSAGTQRFCAPACQAGERRTPTGSCIADVPPVQPSWVTQAKPAVATSNPPAAKPGVPAVCETGKQMVSTFVGGALQNVCVPSCAQGQMLDGNWQCVADTQGVAALIKPPQQPPPCEDAYGGDCSVDFAGMCSVTFVQEVCKKTCGVCTNAGQTSMTKAGSTPQAPVVPTFGSFLARVLPKSPGESVVLDDVALAAALQVTSPDGKTPVQVTGLDFSPSSGTTTDGALPFTAVRQADGRWRITLTGNIRPTGRGSNSDHFYQINVQVDNGLGTNTLTALMTRPF